MKEPHEEGVASHSAPSFAPGTVRCPVKRKQGHGWAGYRASKNCNRDADAVVKAEGNTVRSDSASSGPVPRSRRPHARPETPRTRNRETSEVPVVNSTTGRRGKANSRTPRVHVSEESDSGIVPMNHSNKDGKLWAESEEGRLLIKENTHQSSTHSTQSEARVSQGLEGVRKVARERKERSSPPCSTI